MITFEHKYKEKTLADAGWMLVESSKVFRAFLLLELANFKAFYKKNLEIYDQRRFFTLLSSLDYLSCVCIFCFQSLSVIYFFTAYVHREAEQIRFFYCHSGTSFFGGEFRGSRHTTHDTSTRPKNLYCSTYTFLCKRIKLPEIT